MGLFDKRDTKKKKDDFDSPVEKIDLSAPDPVEMEAEPPPAAEPQSAPAAQSAAPASSSSDDDDDYGDYDSGFGIDKAIELMRTLPADNVELVVQVVKLTLELTKVKVRSIIDDATRKQEDIQGRIKVLKGEIEEFEKEISTRKEEITALEADFAETTTVKDRLQLAEKITRPGAGGGGGASAPAKKISSEGRDTAKASGSIGSPAGSSRPMGSPGPGAKSSVVIKK